MYFAIGMIILIACIAAYVAFREFKLWLLITNMHPTPASQIRPGLVEAEGQVAAAGELLVSPLSQKECVYYKFKVEKKVNNSGSRSRNRSSWRTVISDSNCVNFLIEDRSGSIEVDPKGADYKFKKDSQFRSGTFNDAPEHVEQLLQERYGQTSKGFLFNKAMRYTEIFVEPGDPIYAFGHAVEDEQGMFITTGKPKLILSDKGEGSVSRGILLTAILVGLVSMALFALATFLPFAEKLQR